MLYMLLLILSAFVERVAIAAGDDLRGLGAQDVRWTSVLRGPKRSGERHQQAF